jgi:hypothetical protein
MSKSVQNKINELRYRNPPKEIFDYVLNRCKKFNRTIPKELKTIIEEHEELTKKKK